MPNHSLFVVFLIAIIVELSSSAMEAKETLIVNTVDPTIEAERIRNDDDWKCIIFNPSRFVVDRTFFGREILPKLERMALEENDPSARCVLATIRVNGLGKPATPNDVLNLLSAVPKQSRTLDVELNLLLARAMIDGRDSAAARQLKDETDRLAKDGHRLSQYLVYLREVSNPATRAASRFSLQRLVATDYDLPKLAYFVNLRDNTWNGGIVDLAASLKFCETEVMAENECFYSHWSDILLQAGRNKQRTEWIEAAIQRKNIIAVKIRSIELLQEDRLEEAMALTRTGADLGDSTLQHVYAKSLRIGHGVEIDVVLARRYLELSGGNGNAEAYRELGDMTRDGEGCEPDVGKARSWWEKAAALGDEKSKDRLRN